MTTTALATFQADNRQWVIDELSAVALAERPSAEETLAGALIAAGFGAKSAALAAQAAPRLLTSIAARFVAPAYQRIDEQLGEYLQLPKSARTAPVSLDLRPITDALAACMPVVVAGVAARVRSLSDASPSPAASYNPEVVKQLSLAIHELIDDAERFQLSKSSAPSVVTVERQAGMTPNDMAAIIRAIRESPVQVNVKVDHQAAARDAMVLRDDEGNVIGVRTVPFNVEEQMNAADDAHERAFNAPTAQEDANATAATIGDIRRLPFTPVATAPGRTSPRGVLPGKSAKATRMRELAKSTDSETRNDALAWLRKRNLPTEDETR